MLSPSDNTITVPWEHHSIFFFLNNSYYVANIMLSKYHGIFGFLVCFHGNMITFWTCTLLFTFHTFGVNKNKNNLF